MMRTMIRWVKHLVLLAMASIALYLLTSLSYTHFHETKHPLEAAPATGRFVDVDGISVFTQASGDKNAEPLLLVHGTAAWSGTWFSLTPALEHAGYRVIAVDLPPFGYSDKRTGIDYSRPAQALRLRAVLEAYGVKRAIVVGHSFGGGPALELALIAPEHVQHLVLVDAALGLQAPPPDSSTLACRLLGAPLLRNVAISATAGNPIWSKTLLRSFVARKQAVTDERMLQYRKPSSLEGASAALGAWADHFACATESGASMLPQAIRRLRMPVSLIWGADDTITPLPQARFLQSLLPHATLHVIGGVGHIPHIENPLKFQAVLLQALKDAPADSATAGE